MAEYGLATISVLTPHHRLRPRAADLPRPWNTTQPSPISATHIGKRLAGKLHEPFERAGGGRAISPTSPDSTAGKPANKAEQPPAERSAGEPNAAERVEPRVGTKGNAGQQSRCRTQRRASLSQELERIRQVARERRKERFTALFPHISIELLEAAFFELKKGAAPGVDRLTWKDYEADLERHIEDLHH